MKAKDYYAIGLYPIYIAIGSVYISRIMNHKVGYIIKPILLIMPVLATFLSFDIAFPNKRPEYIIKHQDTYRDLGLLRWEDGKDHEIPQDYADMLGWKELASKVKLAMQKIDSPESTLVLCDNYGQAGAINFYSNGAIKAVSFDADYLNWFDLRIQYTNLIRVKNRDERGTEFIETSPILNLPPLWILLPINTRGNSERPSLYLKALKLISIKEFRKNYMKKIMKTNYYLT